MKKSTLIISLAAAGLISLGGYSVFADNSDSSWNGWCPGPRQTVSRDSRDGSYRQSDRDDYYCPDRDIEGKEKERKLSALFSCL